MPALIKHEDATPEDAVRYLKVYLAAVDVMETSIAKFDTLADYGEDENERNLARLHSLEITRDLDIIKAKRRAFMTDTQGINPPTDAQVQQAQDLDAKLAAVQAHDGKTEAIMGIATDCFNCFQKIHPG